MLRKMATQKQSVNLVTLFQTKEKVLYTLKLKALPHSLHERPLMLGKELDDYLQTYIKSLRGAVNKATRFD